MIKRDVYNLLAEMKKEDSGGNDDDVNVTSFLVDFLTEDLKACCSVYDTSSGKTGLLSIEIFMVECVYVI